MKVSTCVTFVVASTLAILSSSSSITSAHPVTVPTAVDLPSATIFTANNWKGKSANVTKYGCLNHNLGTISSVRYKGGPKANLKFFTGKNCKGKATHQMDTTSFKEMGGPYKSLSVLVSKA